MEKLLKDENDCIVHDVLPRYIISGITTTKSLNMNNSIDRLIKEYSTGKNISQKEMFEIAMIELLKKYGYMDEVRANLSPLLSPWKIIRPRRRTLHLLNDFSFIPDH